MGLRLKRVYAPAEDVDGCRVLVDRLWPRGLARERLRIDAWRSDLAPSPALRRWFGHEPAKWPEFRRRYLVELAGRREQAADLAAKAGTGRVTLLYAARDEQHNHAVVLGEYLEELTREIRGAVGEEET